MNKPQWLRKQHVFSYCHPMKTLLAQEGVNTICESARCPNMSDCFSRRQVTFLILGKVCTRHCKFCNVKSSLPEPVDYSEITNIERAVKRLRLAYVVVTSPSRDDLADGGAGMYADTVKMLYTLECVKHVEVLIPDFQGNHESLETVVSSRPDVIGHNIETVPSLYQKVRPQADYRRSLAVLKKIKNIDGTHCTKSSLMIGLGEQSHEVYAVLNDLKKVGCDIVCIGQYLPGSRAHYPVQEYIPPSQFVQYRDYAFSLGFRTVFSAPYVRSSYHADTLFPPRPCTKIS